MHLENISLSKEYVNEVENAISVVHVYFENALQHVKLFYPQVHILRDKVYLIHEMIDEK